MKTNLERFEMGKAILTEMYKAEKQNLSINETWELAKLYQDMTENLKIVLNIK